MNPDAGRRPTGQTLQAQSLTARHGFVRLGPLALDLPAGQYGCLLGPSGAGKTLLLRAICGLAGSAGRLTFGGTDLRPLPPRRRRFALLAGDGGLPPGESVAAGLRFAMAARGIKRAQRSGRLAALLTEFGLSGTDRADRLDPDTRFRARLATALAGDPALLLLDDPLANCDDRPALIELLRAVQAQRRLAVLHATRRREEAFGLADHLVLMERGQVLQAGTASALYERPDSLFIARRLGPANVLDGIIEEIENDVAYVRLECGPLIEAEPPASEVILPAAGLACRVLLRPERISISRVAAAELGEGAIAAVLRDITHMGDLLRLTVAIGTDTDISITRPAALGTAGLSPGCGLAIAWQSRHALTFVTP